MARFRDALLRLLGSSSGETILKAAAAASGTLTFPAGTTDFSATGGSSQVVKQTGSGAAFTVGQLAQSDISGTLTPDHGGTGVANNAASTITISGAFATTVTVSAATNSTLPAGTHTLAGLDVAQTWSAAQSYNSGDLKLNGATSGAITLNAAAVAGTNTITLPAGTTDFSVTGGTSQVVKQTSSGGPFTVGQLTFPDLSDYTPITSFSPTVSSNTGTITSYSVVYAKYIVIRNITFVQYVITITNNGTGGGFLIIDLPPKVPNQNAFGAGRNLNTGAPIYGGSISGTQISCTNISVGYPVVTGDSITLDFWYFSN